MGISILNLTKSFDEKVIFEKLSHVFPDVGVALISGKSGCGKTTLLRIISGIDKIYGGSVDVDGRVSFAFQEYRLLPWLNAVDNVSVAAFDSVTNEAKNAARSTLRRLGFSERDMHLYPSELSGGMKQRVSLARAFLADSDILILDEPTKELDKDLSSTVYSMIAEASTDRLVLLVTHESVPNSLQIADRMDL